MRFRLLPSIVRTAMLATAGAVGSRGQNEAKDETRDIRLDIREKRITEAPFERTLTADLDARDVRLRVGVDASADRIDVTLIGVTGDVHFRASLASLRERLGRIFQLQNR